MLYNPDILFPAVHAIEIKAYIYVCLQMLFIILKKWKQFISPTTGQRITL